jgi:hypothetical protein
MAFNYFIKIRDRFDINLAMVAMIVTFSLGIRNTTVIGWIPILLFKMIEELAVVPFAASIILIVLPTFGIIFVIDTLYYESYTVTAWNYFQN